MPARCRPSLGCRASGCGSDPMKPAAFDYRQPRTLAEAVALLAADPGAKAIADGQNLMPLLNFRVAAPNLLVHLRHLPGLDHSHISADGIRLRASVRSRDIADD